LKILGKKPVGGNEKEKLHTIDPKIRHILCMQKHFPG